MAKDKKKSKRAKQKPAQQLNIMTTRRARTHPTQAIGSGMGVAKPPTRSRKAPKAR